MSPTTHNPLSSASGSFCFGPLTKAYNTVCTEYMAASRQNVVSKASWAGLFRQAWEQAVTP